MIPPLLLFPINPSVSKTERPYRAPPPLLQPRSLNSFFHPRLHAQRRENLHPLCTPPLTSLVLHGFQIREYMDERPDLLSHSSHPSCLLPPLFCQEPSSNNCCSMDTRACSRRLTTPPSKSLRSKVLLHVMIPFREEGTRSIDHT